MRYAQKLCLRVAELDSTRHALRAYAWGLDLSGTMDDAAGVGGLVLIREVGSEGYFPSYDGNGNLKCLVKASNRSVAARYDYGPFGEPMVANGSYAAQNRFRFSTKHSDSVSGLYYYGYRFYSPRLGRWPSRDPLEEEGGINLYGFLSNNPLGSVDLYGLVNYAFDVQGFHVRDNIDERDLTYIPVFNDDGTWAVEAKRDISLIRTGQ